MADMNNSKSDTVICRYTVKPGREAEMEQLFGLHWPALHKLGLVTEEPSRFFKEVPSGKPGEPKKPGTVYVEIFSWKTKASPDQAHQSPEVMAVWDPMFEVCEVMEFPHFQELDLLKSS
ncbi:MAG: hypothetical protein ACI8TQ_002425 [Planctomycetota bacterium]|jgi:hypothetical protein